MGISATEKNKAGNGDSKCWEMVIVDRVAGESLIDRVIL